MSENDLKDDERKMEKNLESKKLSVWYNNVEKSLKDWQKKD